MKKIKADMVAGALFMVFGLFFLIQTASNPQMSFIATTSDGVPGGGFFPYILSILIIIMGGALVVRGARTEGKKYVELTEENKKQFYIPEGFAHGFLVLSDLAEFCYKCTDFYHPGDEGGLAWNDPEIGIEWPQLVGEYKGNASAEGYQLEDGTALNLSDKDQKWVGLKDTFHF